MVLMRPVLDIVRDIESLDASAPASSLHALASEIESHSDGARLIGTVLQLFERLPDADFGSPGPLVHAIEQFYGRGYEEELLRSLRRCPTHLTLWLANRIANAGDANAPRFV